MKLTEINGIGPESAKDFEEAGYRTVESIFSSTEADIIKIVKSDAKGQRIYAEAMKLMDKQGVFKPRKGDQTREKTERLSTGIRTLDAIIESDGLGFKPYTILCYGRAGFGKTVFSRNLIYQTARKGKKTMYIYTPGEDDVDKANIKAMEEELGDVKLSASYYSLYLANLKHLEYFIDKALPTYVKEGDVRLLIIDSYSGMTRRQFSGTPKEIRAMHVERNRKTLCIWQLLQPLMENHGLFVYVTAHVVPQTSGYGGYNTSGIPEALKHIAKYIIEIKRHDSVANYRFFQFKQTRTTPAIQEAFAITSAGFIETKMEMERQRKEVEKKKAEQQKKEEKK